MADYFTSFKKTVTGRIVFILSVIVSLFWILGQIINVYRFALTGTLFEILWLPIVAMTIFLPIVSVVFLIKEKFSLRSFYLYSLLMIAATILVLEFRK